MKNKKHLLIHADDAFLFDQSKFIYHVTNLDKIIEPYERLMRTMGHKLSPGNQLIARHIETLKLQLFQNSSNHIVSKRSLNFLGSIVKFITGVPDHYDLIEIQKSLNDIIENNNKQIIVNSKVENLLNNLNKDTIIDSLLLKEILYELANIVKNLNFSKQNIFFSESLNLKDVKEIIHNENFNLPIINILEYADNYLCRANNLIISIYKYPIIKLRCKLYDVIALSYRHGKVQLDKQIAFYDQKYQRVENCKNFLDSNICKINHIKNNCTIRFLNNLKAQCNIIQEDNSPLNEVSPGNIIITGQHKVDNETVDGVNLIKFLNQVNIDNQTFINFKNKVKDTYHSEAEETIEVLDILTSESVYKFDNLKKLRKFSIPIEDHPIITTLVIIAIILFLIIISFVGLKIHKLCLAQKQLRLKEKRHRLYKEALKARGIKSEDTLF